MLATALLWQGVAWAHPDELSFLRALARAEKSRNLNPVPVFGTNDREAGRPKKIPPMQATVRGAAWTGAVTGLLALAALASGAGAYLWIGLSVSSLLLLHRAKKARDNLKRDYTAISGKSIFSDRRPTAYLDGKKPVFIENSLLGMGLDSIHTLSYLVPFLGKWGLSRKPFAYSMQAAAITGISLFGINYPGLFVLCVFISAGALFMFLSTQGNHPWPLSIHPLDPLGQNAVFLSLPHIPDSAQKGIATKTSPHGDYPYGERRSFEAFLSRVFELSPLPVAAASPYLTVDIGSSFFRYGPWQEMFFRKKYPGRGFAHMGIDTNPVIVANVSLNLEEALLGRTKLIHRDIFDYMTRVRPNSLHFVSLFHPLKQYPTYGEQLPKLLEEVYGALAPGCCFALAFYMEDGEGEGEDTYLNYSRSVIRASKFTVVFDGPSGADFYVDPALNRAHGLYSNADLDKHRWHHLILLKKPWAVRDDTTIRPATALPASIADTQI